jgi:dTDP-4-amino-4,6-dideoxygalactose transaminase
LNVAAQLIRRSDGDEVIVPAITFVSTAMAFHIAGMRPVPVDVRPDTLLLDEEAVIRHLTPRTRAVVVVHLYGQQQDVSGLRMLCDRHGLALIEDCAHRIGNLAETPVGDFACYSFNAVKEAPAGDGGLLWARDATLEPAAREITYLGMTIDTFQRAATSLHREYGFGCGGGGKLRLTDVAATFVLACLGHMDEWRAKRRSVFARYEKELPMAMASVSLFPRLATDSCLMFVVRVPHAERSSVRRALADVGIATSMHYPSLSRHPLWSQFAAPCPVAEQAEDEVLTLPCFPDMDSQAQDRVISAWETACR